MVLDIWLQGSKLDGIEVLDVIKREHPDLPVVMISGHGTIETAVASIKKGAYDFVEKPFKADRLLHVVERALEAARLKREVQELKLKAGDEGELVGNSSTITQFAPADRQDRAHQQPGADRRARRLGQGSGGAADPSRSRRAGNAFVAINCATMEPDRLETELFGSESMGDRADGPRKTGLFELAHNGTLYLDEVADMPLETQGKILRVLIDQTFTRVGGSTRVQVDARVICFHHPRPARRDRGRALPRGPLSPPECGAGAHAVAGANGATTFPLLVDPFHEAAVGGRRPADAHHRRRRHGGAADPWLAGQCPPAAQYRGAAADPGQRRVTEAVTADLLPTDLGSIAPRRCAATKGGEVISLPLREAREIFERDYLMAQINRFGGNISAPPPSSAWSARRCIAS